jgi:uncharacterized protein (TIGR03118 family)
VVVAGALTLTGTAGPALAGDRHHDRDKHNAFVQTNLVSDIPGLGGITDPNLINPWGIAFSATSPLWTSNQGSNTSTLYRGTTRENAVAFPPPPNGPLVVNAVSPTGIVFNPTTDFVVTQNGTTAPARFIFNETAGDPTDPNAVPVTSITAWHNGTSTVPGSAPKTGAAYAGLALVPGPKYGKGGSALLAANNVPGGNIDIYDAQFHQVTPKKGHDFVDPHIDLTKTPPYNVAYLDGRVYVAYAAFGPDDQSAVSVFTADGKFRKRLVTGGPLVAPWGMTIAPKGWGEFGGDLLVGNVGDGTINAFNPSNGHFRGTIKDADGNPIVNVGLWGLQFGNGAIGTPNSLVFAAGIGETPTDFDHFYQHGLVGLIEPVADNDDD